MYNAQEKPTSQSQAQARAKSKSQTTIQDKTAKSPNNVNSTSGQKTMFAQKKK